MVFTKYIGLKTFEISLFDFLMTFIMVYELKMKNCLHCRVHVSCACCRLCVFQFLPDN